MNAIAEVAAPGDTVIATGLLYAPVAYYLQRAANAPLLNVRGVPTATEQHPGWYDSSPAAVGAKTLSTDVESLASAWANDSRVFVAEHTASERIGQINLILHRAIVRDRQLGGIVHYAAGANRDSPTFQVIEYPARSE